MIKTHFRPGFTPSKTSLSRVLSFAAIFIFVLSSIAVVAHGQSKIPVITKAAQIRKLTAEQSQLKIPVVLRGIITYNIPEWGTTFLQDATGGVYLQTKGMDNHYRAGDLVEVQGAAGLGEFAPVVEHPIIRVLGKATLPAAQLFPIEDLQTGEEDSQWVEVRGIVHSVRFLDYAKSPAKTERPPALVLGISAGNNKFRAWIKDYPEDKNLYVSLIDSEVTLRGVCGTLFNDKRQLVGIQLFVPNLDQVHIEKAASPDPFALPILPTHSLMRFSPEKASGHRLRVQGVVTLVKKGQYIFVQDAFGGIVVFSSQKDVVEPGDRVDAVGFPTMGQYSPQLEDGEFRKIGRGAMPAPADLTRATSLSGAHDAELVKIKGQLIDQSIWGTDVFLLVQSGTQTFTAWLPNGEALDAVRSIPVGSVIETTGVWSVDTDPYRSPLTYRVLLRSSRDIVVLKRPSWWSIQHTLWALALTIGLMLVVFGWAAALRRQVSGQTGVLLHRLHRIANLEERYRLLFERNLAGVFRMTLDNRIAECNEACARILGYFSREELFPVHVSQVFADPKFQLATLDRLKREKVLTNYEMSLKRKDGGAVWVLANLSLIEKGGSGWIEGTFIDITERKKAEDAVRKAEDRYRDLVENSGVLIGTQDLDGTVLSVNRAGLKIFGCDRAEDLVGHNLSEYLATNVRDLFQSYLQDVQKNGQSHGLMKVRTRQGEQRMIEFDNSLRQEGLEKPIIRCIGRDITERKRAEDALRSSEERVRLLLDSTAEAIYGIDLLGKCTFANAACLRMLGYQSSEAVMGRNMHELMHHTRADGTANPVTECRIHQAFQRGLGSHVDTEILWRADGTSFPAEYWSYPVRSGAKVAGSVVTFLDITERKRAKETQDRLTAIVEATTDLVGIAGADTQITYINEAGRKMIGIGEDDDVSGLSIIGYYPEHLKARILGEAIPAAIRDGAWSGETALLARDGKEIQVSQVILAHKAADGAVKYLSTIIRDITGTKRAEIELRTAKEAAEFANRAKSEFLAIMSHEIRTPMNGIIGMTDLTLDTSLSSEQREYLGMVKSSADSLLTIINDILDFSKIEAGKLDLEVIEVNLRSSLANAMKSLALRAHEKGLELAYHFHPEVPRVLSGDPVRLRQIVINLVGNAIKFTERGEVVVRVEPESKTVSTIVLHYSVSDTGIGIPADKQQLIFEAFSQSDSSTTRKYGGTGLGLAISARLVRMMGGRIWVESEPGRGSTFHFTVPFEIPKEMAATPVVLEPISLRGQCVLVVDDNATNRRILGEMLTNWHMKPTMAESGLQALAFLERSRDAGSTYPLVLLDAKMPDMDGFTLAERIKQSPELAGATIMMLTSSGQRGDGARCRELGISAYLTKPIRQSDLLDAIITVLAKSPRKAEPVPLVTRHSLRENQRHLNILLAEDNAVNQTLAVRLLEKHGHTVVVTDNGREALDAFENSFPGEFDLLLMDVQMPEMDGFEVTAAIREREKITATHVPILAMTANAMQGDREKCMRSGMDGYVAKPVQVEELLLEIERLVPSTFGEPGGATAGREAGGLIDRAAVLDSLGGNTELLGEMAGLFLRDSASLLIGIREAVAHSDGNALELSAHKLRGSVGNFTTGPVYKAAHRLETMGRENNFTHAEEAFLNLEKETKNFNSALKDMEKQFPSQVKS
ncbi:MAG: PAS domain S-box protein [Terriglobia bacterium]